MSARHQRNAVRACWARFSTAATSVLWLGIWLPVMPALSAGGPMLINDIALNDR
jgi:hypothetical protein